MQKTTEISFCEVDTSGGIDSGYVSLRGTPKGTPENTQENFATEFQLQSQKLFQRKVTKLKPFNKPIPSSAQDRFRDLNELFNKPLCEYLAKQNVRFSAISIKLRVLGESETTSKPWIVVLCDKTAVKRVRQFFSQRWVKSELQSCDLDPPLPSFDIIVYDRPPRPLAATSFGDVYGLPLEFDTISCGHLIKVGNPELSRTATLGGIVQVDLSDKGSVLYGMTAAHLIPGMLPEPIEAGLDTYDEETDVDEKNSEDEYYCELDMTVDETGDSSNGKYSSHGRFSKFGYISAICCDPQGEIGNLDWALIKFEEMTQYPSYLVNKSNPWDATLAGVADEPQYTGFEETGQLVNLLSGTNGRMSGDLSFTSSWLLLHSGKSFTKVFTVTLHNDCKLNPGDSGSWVVDSVSLKVYGHVTASDVFGDIYVIPLVDTLHDIKTQLKASSVSLPSIDRTFNVSHGPRHHFRQYDRLPSSSSLPPDYGRKRRFELLLEEVADPCRPLNIIEKNSKDEKKPSSKDSERPNWRGSNVSSMHEDIPFKGLPSTSGTIAYDSWNESTLGTEENTPNQSKTGTKTKSSPQSVEGFTDETFLDSHDFVHPYSVLFRGNDDRKPGVFTDEAAKITYPHSFLESFDYPLWLDESDSGRSWPPQPLVIEKPKPFASTLDPVRDEDKTMNLSVDVACKTAYTMNPTKSADSGYGSLETSSTSPTSKTPVEDPYNFSFDFFGELSEHAPDES